MDELYIKPIEYDQINKLLRGIGIEEIWVKTQTKKRNKLNKNDKKTTNQLYSANLINKFKFDKLK